MPRNEAKVKFTADTREFTAQIRDANSSMASMRAALALNEAQFKNTGNGAEYLQNKQKILQQQLEQSRAKQDALNAKLEAASTIYGENSTEAQSWATKLTRAQIEEEKLKGALDETEAAIEEQTEAQERAKTPLEQLTNEIKDQQDELSRLKTEYANTALSEGQESEAAQELKAKIDALNTELDQNESKLAEVTGATERAAGATKEASSGWTMAKQVLANLATDGLRMVADKLKEAAKEVIKLGTDFTASMSNVQALSGATSAEMEKLEATAKELGRATVFSATDVSDAFGYMALAGWDTTDMLSGVDGVLTLAAASQMDLAKASDIVTDYLTAFGLSAQDSGKFVDQMAYAMSHSNTNTEQLGEAYKNVASTANSLHFSVEDTTAALMTMANAGVKGGEAGTGLSAIMTRLATNTKDCADELGTYGIQVYDSQGNINSLSSILNGMAGIWIDLTDQQQANLAKTVAGQNQYSKLQTVMNGLSEQAEATGSSFNDYTEALANCEGAATEMSDTMQDNLQGDMKALESAAQGLGLQLFEFFEGPLRTAAQGAASALNKITDAITPQRSEMQAFIAETQSMIESSRSALDNADGLTRSATDRVGELEAYKTVLLELNQQAELDEYQQYQLKNAVDALGDSVPGLSAAFDETTGTLNLTNKELVDMFNNAEALAMQQALIDAQTESFKALSDATIAKARADASAKKATEELSEAEKKNQESVQAGAGEYGDYYNEVIRANEAVKDSKEQQEAAQKAMDDAQEAIEIDKEALVGLAEQFGMSQEQLESLTSSQEGATETEEAAAEATGEYAAAQGQLSEEAQKAAEEVEKAYDDMMNKIRDSMQSSVGFMEEFNGGQQISAEQMNANLQSQIEGISNWSENMQRLAAETGEGMRQDMYDALVQMGPEAANLVQELVDTLDSDTPQFQQICDNWAQAMDLSNNASALAAATTAGKAYTGELAAGIQSGEGDVAGAAKGIADAATKNADTSAAAKAVSKGLTDNVSKSLSTASKTAATQSGKMKQSVQTGMNGMSAAASLQMGKFKRTVSSAMSEAARNVQSGVSSMRNALNVTIQGPHIKVPHFRMVGEFNAQTKATPSVTVSYYAKGAIFTKPTIFATETGFKGVGEAGPEAVLPIENLREYVSDAVEAAGSATTINNYVTVNGTENPESFADRFLREVMIQGRLS